MRFVSNFSSLAFHFTPPLWQRIRLITCQVILFDVLKFLKFIPKRCLSLRCQDISSYAISTAAISTAAISTAAISTAAISTVHTFNRVPFQPRAILEISDDYAVQLAMPKKDNLLRAVSRKRQTAICLPPDAIF